MKKQEIKDFFKSLLDLEGWKKDSKKIAVIIGSMVAVILLVTVAVKISQMQSWSLRFNSPIETVEHQEFKNENFSFFFPERYVLDKNEQKKFGADYLAGFHLADDDRTGCDVRSSEIGINFSKSDQEIKDAFIKELSANVKGFDQFKGERLQIGKRDAFKVSFLLTDPLGNKLKINQVLLSGNNENYLLVCGSGSAMEKFFQKDFNDFFKSFRLE